MALNKNIKSLLLVATIVAGGSYIGIENSSLAKENESLKKTINNTSVKLQEKEKSYEELNELLKEKGKELEETQKSLEDTQKSLEDVETNLNKTKQDLDTTKTKLKETEKQLEAKKQASVAVASVTPSSCPTDSVNTTSTTTTKGTPIKITMTFYGSNIDGMSDMTASGKKVAAGYVASNYYPFGTKFEYNGQIYTVMDRGGKGLNGPNNLDIYVPRKAGESDAQYRARLYQYGRKTVIMNKL